MLKVRVQKLNSTTDTTTFKNQNISNKALAMDFSQEIDVLIDIAITEDIRSGDITSESCIPEDAITSGRLFLKQSGVIAGLSFLSTIYHKIDPSIEVTLFVEEGSYQKTGTVIAKVTGPARGIISGERVALNIIQHASSVATTTNSYVRKIAGLDCKILDTRKTTPCLRSLEKYAVQVGGGCVHRLGLDDRFIIKNNHLAFIGGSRRHLLTTAVSKVKAKNPNLPIEVEIQDPALLDEALEADIDAVMLNKMTPYEIRRCVKKVRKTNKKIFVESSFAINLDTIRAYAETGVDGISVKYLTSSIEELNIGMRITP